jgi:predicted metal-binding protein
MVIVPAIDLYEGKVARLAEIAMGCGFTFYTPLDISTLEFLQEIRESCCASKCKNYDTSWSCPPAVSSLEDIRERVKEFSTGILVQTVGEIEDSFDWSGIIKTEARHKENFGRMRDLLEKESDMFFAMGAGKCRICEICAYPDNPCRYPNKMEVSMEACGLFVTKVCTDNNLAYNYGTDKIAFTSCFLLE